MAQVRSVGLMLKMYTLLRQERENLVRLRGLNGTGLLPKVLCRICVYCLPVALKMYVLMFDAYKYPTARTREYKKAIKCATVTAFA